MKKYIFLGIAFIGLAACIHAVGHTLYYPEVPDVVYDKMKAVVTEMGYQISVDEKYRSGTEPWLYAQREGIRISAKFSRQSGETVVDLNIGYFGSAVKETELATVREEIISRLNAALKKHWPSADLKDLKTINIFAITPIYYGIQ